MSLNQLLRKGTSRIPDSYHAKTLKNTTPSSFFASSFHNQAVFQKSECRFFDQVPIHVDAKSVLKLENCPLVAELKFKMSQNMQFLCFQLCHQRAVLKCQYTFNIYGTWSKKLLLDFSNKIIRHNLTGGSDFHSFLHHNY